MFVCWPSGTLRADENLVCDRVCDRPCVVFTQLSDGPAEALSLPHAPATQIDGRTYMFTRRCSERRFFLCPGPS